MNPGIILFMGAVRRGEFESLQSRGLPLGILIDTNSKHRMPDLSSFALVERFDFSRPLADLTRAVEAIQRRTGIQCLYNVIEFYVAQTAHVAAELGLPGLSPSSAALCLDKNLMRRRFQERIGAGVTARFREVHAESDLLSFAREVGYPVFLQPANVSASMWATRNEDEAGLLHNYRTILREVPAYYERLGKRGQSLSIAVAEYLEGANVSVDCVIDRYGRVHTTPAVFVLTGKDIGINDYHHFARVLPSRLSPAQEEELLELSINGCEALDMHSAAAHVEFIGKRLGEIAARPGGNRPRILELAYGMDLLYAFYQALAGETPRLTRVSRNAAAIISPYPARAGTLRAINHLAELPQLPGYLYHEIRAQPGTAVGTASGGFRAPLYVELRSPDENEVRRGLDQLIAWSDIYVVE